jgi:hypothetical protein
MKLRGVTILKANTETVSENLLGKKVQFRGQTVTVVRVYEVLGSLKETQR